MILLDTHVLVHYRCDDGKLGRRALSAIGRALDRDRLFVSAISFWEIATLLARGRLELDTSVTVFRDVAIHNGAQELAMDGSIAILSAELPPAHGDPADRILVATAIERGLALVTADSVLLEWKLRGFRVQDATE